MPKVNNMQSNEKMFKTKTIVMSTIAIIFQSLILIFQAYSGFVNMLFGIFGLMIMTFTPAMYFIGKKTSLVVAINVMKEMFV